MYTNGIAHSHTTKRSDDYHENRRERTKLLNPVLKAFKAALKPLEEEYKVYAEGDYMCCSSCAWAEASKYMPRGSEVFVFFHEQDADKFLNSGTLSIRYGRCSGSEMTDEAFVTLMKEQVVPALEEGGFAVEWEGDIFEVLCVKFLW